MLETQAKQATALSTRSLQDSRSPALILGVVFGAICGLATIVALTWFLRHRHESQKRASRALAYDPAPSSDDPEAPHIMGSHHEGSVHCSIGSPQLTGIPGLGHQMGYVDTPLGSPGTGDGSIYKGGAISGFVSPVSPLVPSVHGEYPVFEMHADVIGPAELPA
ncbi:hypothetical protein DID88_001544 [Monilinia fructigena]|uniref:Uncharacterized protein n=1 Tax=Monilinia fructigena TaxID=38457 RepID=A0A395IZU1_9HELO|nr:hypothetical protein DID88_001544 [Monilinia fructigena]